MFNTFSIVAITILNDPHDMSKLGEYKELGLLGSFLWWQISLGTISRGSSS